MRAGTELVVSWAALVACVLPLAALGCVRPPRMCGLPNECGPQSSCVAGRCQKTAGIPAIQQARRLVVDPVDVAYVRSIDAPREGALPTSFTLGREGDGDARLYLRFSVPLAKETNVVEAYLLLERADVMDADPDPVALHAARVIDAWDARTISWARQPRNEETRSPVTVVTASGRVRVRVDVKDLVSRWRAHDRKDQGLVLLAENTTPTGVAFSFAPGAASSNAPTKHSGSPSETAGSRPLFGEVSADVGKVASSSAEPLAAGPIGAPPQLELYLK